MKLKEFLDTHNTDGSEHWDIEISTSTYNSNGKVIMGVMH